MLELLAPAGSMEALIAAVQNGANAVYLGCGGFNARQSAKNFTPQTLADAVKYCHIRGVKVHLTLNTLVSDREEKDLCDLVRHAANCGVDAFIVQDWGVAQLCRQIAPNVDLHASTQMSVHSLDGVRFCERMGCKRVVLSRELNREQIRKIVESTNVEIEIFGHGALCMCYSGQCYMSSIIGGRSGNRGRCAQPCRQTYGYGRWENKHPLSLKDNCLVQYLEDMARMGVVSVKLEGRMKRPEYVAAVTGVYRQALDGKAVTREMMDTLMRSFNRQGFTDGYYTGRLGEEMFGYRDDDEDNTQWLKSMRRTYEAVENGVVPVRFRITLDSRGSRLTVIDPEGRECSADGPVPEQARKISVTEQMLTERVAKTGGTPYHCVGVETDMEPGLMLSAAAINAMRRQVLDQLTALRGRREIPELHRPGPKDNYTGFHAAPKLTVQVTSWEQITDKLLATNLELLYVPLHLLAASPERTRKLCRTTSVAAVLPRICTDDDRPGITAQLQQVRSLGVDAVLVGNVGLLMMCKRIGLRTHGDFGLNLFNSRSMTLARGLELASATLSFEMTLPQIRDVSKSVSTEILIYGRLPLMVTENCLIRGRTGNCACHMGTSRLTDRTGADFPLIRDGASCRSVVLNGKKLYWLDRRNDLSRLGLWATRLYFTTENPTEVDHVLEAYHSGKQFEPSACTRGLYLRGLE